MALEENMSEPWNRWDLRPPPTCTVKTEIKESDFMDIRKIIHSGTSTLKKMTTLKQEALLLSRYLYRYKRLFRQDKGMQQLVKINQCLHRYLKLNLAETFSIVKGCLPSNISSDGTYLPTQQMFKWLLLRLLSLSKILLRLLELSKYAGKFIYGRLCLGWSSHYMAFALGVCGRVLVCAKFVLQNTTEWYNALRVHLLNFKETVEYMPNYDFPSKLEDFIGHVDLEPLTRKEDIDKIFELIDLTEANESDEDDVLIMGEIINTYQSDDDIQITHEDVVSDGTSENKGKKRFREDEGLSIVYEKHVPTLFNSSSKVLTDEDLGCFVPKKKKNSKKKKNRKFNNKLSCNRRKFY